MDEPGYGYEVIHAGGKAQAERIARRHYPKNESEVYRLRKNEDPEERFEHEIQYYGTIEDAEDFPAPMRRRR